MRTCVVVSARRDRDQFDLSTILLSPSKYGLKLARNMIPTFISNFGGLASDFRTRLNH